MLQLVALVTLVMGYSLGEPPRTPPRDAAATADIGSGPTSLAQLGTPTSTPTSSPTSTPTPVRIAAPTEAPASLGERPSQTTIPPPRWRRLTRLGSDDTGDD